MFQMKHRCIYRSYFQDLISKSAEVTEIVGHCFSPINGYLLFMPHSKTSDILPISVILADLRILISTKIWNIATSLMLYVLLSGGTTLGLEFC